MAKREISNWEVAKTVVHTVARTRDGEVRFGRMFEKGGGLDRTLQRIQTALTQESPEDVDEIRNDIEKVRQAAANGLDVTWELVTYGIALGKLDAYGLLDESQRRRAKARAQLQRPNSRLSSDERQEIIDKAVQYAQVRHKTLTLDTSGKVEKIKPHGFVGAIAKLLDRDPGTVREVLLTHLRA